jgi:hypothetical protein
MYALPQPSGRDRLSAAFERASNIADSRPFGNFRKGESVLTFVFYKVLDWQLTPQEPVFLPARLRPAHEQEP